MIKAPLKFLIALGALCAATAGAQAALYTDLDFIGVKLTKGGAVSSYSGTFQISSQDPDGWPDIVGYNPATEVITLAVAEFFVKDDGLLGDIQPEKVIITLGPNIFADTQAATFLVAVGNVTGLALIDLSDGILSYTITATTGDFIAVKAFLAVHTSPAPVPDGGSMLALLGFGLVGLGLVRSRLS